VGFNSSASGYPGGALWETLEDVWIPDYTKYGKEYKPAGKAFPESGTIALSCL